MLKALKHLSVCLAAVAVIFAAPLAKYISSLSGKEEGIVARASTVLPEQPSGEFVVLMKNSLHEKNLSEWEKFFSGETVVIFDDISCLVAEGDVSGKQLAERFMAELPENQMSIKEINPTLLVSKAEKGYIDVAVFSKEQAEALKLSSYIEGVSFIKIFNEA